MGEILDKIKGTAKQAAGVVTHNDRLVRAGKADVMKGEAKGAIKDIKRAGRKAVQAVKDAVK